MDTDKSRQKDDEKTKGKPPGGKGERRGGAIVIRFELPFDVWCAGCGAHAAIGTRYNAEKRSAGKYFSTTIYHFRMKCFLCSTFYEIQSDPEHRTYNCVAGCFKKTETYVTDSAVELTETDDRKKIDENPIFKLEHVIEDKRRSDVARSSLEEIHEMRHDQFRDDYAANQMLRKRMRGHKAEAKALEVDRKRLHCPVPLLAAAPEDAKSAAKVLFTQDLLKQSISHHKRTRVGEIRASSIFGSATPEQQRRDELARKRRNLGLHLGSEKGGASGDAKRARLMTEAKPAPSPGAVSNSLVDYGDSD